MLTEAETEEELAYIFTDSEDKIYSDYMDKDPHYAEDDSDDIHYIKWGKAIFILIIIYSILILALLEGWEMFAYFPIDIASLW